jgi:hypothetical protein
MGLNTFPAGLPVLSTVLQGSEHIVKSPNVKRVLSSSTEFQENYAAVIFRGFNYTKKMHLQPSEPCREDRGGVCGVECCVYSRTIEKLIEK